MHVIRVDDDEESDVELNSTTMNKRFVEDFTIEFDNSIPDDK